MEYPIEASCQCGKVTYKLHEPPQMVLACHCTECQKLSTSPFSVTALVAAGSIDFDGEMKDWGRLAESGNRNHAKFCPECGTRIYHYNPDDPATVKLKLKPVHLANTRLFEPSAHVWVSEKLDWYRIPEGVKVFEKQP
ncbi:GFA family protein [Microbulbifer aggregans]|uniref:GFA family protein n=1 Tax=Microbulbifer aggregans TaxID=1769779 RepID=UPI001CFD88D0|nr:GFA family protein [Microbulbifer aggregans]